MTPPPGRPDLAPLAAGRLRAAFAALTSLAVLAPLALLTLTPADARATIATPAADETALAARIVAEGTERSRVMEPLEHLTKDIGPRLTGSSALTRAGEWAVEVFSSYGLDARLEAWGEVPMGFERGPSRGGVVAPDARPLTFITRAWTPGTDGPARGPARLFEIDLAEAPSGQGLSRSEREANLAAFLAEALDGLVAAHGDGLSGSWLLVPRTLRLRASLRVLLEETARDRGLHGLIHPSSESQLLVMSGNLRVDPDALPDVVWIEVVADEWDALAARVRAGEAVELEFDIDNRFVPGPVTQYNVVADLVGSDFPDEYVIVGGHLDSWDGAEGAQDNATGCATSLEAARLLTASGARPRRTIRFMLWGGEEQGLLGSSAYVEQHPELMDRISAVLVHDGGTNAATGISLTPAMAEQGALAFGAVLDYVASTAGARPFEVQETPGLVAGGGSDHVPFIRAGVPGFFWRQQGDSSYTHVHHTQHDTLETASEDDLRHTALVVALSALGLADLDERLDRTRMSVPRRTLGVFLDGAMITGLVGSGQAARRGMREGDELLTIGGEPVAGASVRNLLAAGEGRKVITWRRGEEELSDVFLWNDQDDELTRPPEPLTLVTDDGVELAADWYAGHPDGLAQGGAVILLHMYRSDRRAWQPVRDELHRAGLATLALDLRGHGESAALGGAQGADLAARVAARETAVFQAMDHDVAAAVAWLEAQRFEPRRIGLMGASVGCSVALRAARADPRLGGVVALSPGTAYLGLDSLADVADWDMRPVMLVSSAEEAEAGARPLHAALIAGDRFRPAQLVIVDGPDGDGADLHGTRMFGKVPRLEQRLADWWLALLR